MIKLEIIDSPDKEVIGIHTINKNMIFLGKNKGDVLIFDHEIIDLHICFELSGKYLITHKNKKITEYYLNDQNTTTDKLTKIGDQILIGNTLIKIIDFKFNINISKKKQINDNLEKITSRSSLKEIKEIVDILSDDLAKFS